jgi:hypothetical protein
MNHTKIRQIRDEICKGCLTYETYLEDLSPTIACVIPHKKDGKVCPCSTCLIKGVCQDSCERLRDYKRLKTVSKKRTHQWEYKGHNHCGNSMPKLYSTPYMPKQTNERSSK